MTQIGLGYGSLIQQGMQSGAAAYRASQQLAMQRQAMEEQRVMDALRRQAMQQDIDQRAQAAREYVAQQEADREFMDLYAKTYLAEPVVQAPAPRTGMGPADDSTLGVVQPAPPPAMPDWKQLSRASPRVQNLFLEAGENARLTREREKKDREEFAKMVGSDMSSFMGPREDTPEGWTGLANQYRRAMERGDVTSADVRKHAPPKVLAILDADEEGHRARLVDYLTTNAGPDGATVRDEAGAILLSGYPTRQLEAMTSSRRNEERKMAAEKAQRDVLDAAYAILNDPNASPEYRAKAQAALAQLNAPMPSRVNDGGPRNVTIANDRVVQAFEAGLKMVNDATKEDTSEEANQKRRSATEAYQAALRGLVTPDGWAILNGGRPRADGAYLVQSADGASGWVTADVLREKLAGGAPVDAGGMQGREDDEAYGGGEIGGVGVGNQGTAPVGGKKIDTLIDALIDESIGGGE